MTLTKLCEERPRSNIRQDFEMSIKSFQFLSTALSTDMLTHLRSNSVTREIVIYSLYNDPIVMFSISVLHLCKYFFEQYPSQISGKSNFDLTKYLMLAKT